MRDYKHEMKEYDRWKHRRRVDGVLFLAIIAAILLMIYWR